MFYWLNTFLLYSIFGHFLETLFFFVLKLPKRSGFMFLWWTPLYGIGAVLSLLIYNFLNEKVKNKLYLNILLFLVYFFSFTILEYLGGFLIEMIFNYKMWDYSNIWGHIGDFASLPTSLGWSLMAMFYIYVLKRFSDKIILKVPNVLSIILFIVFIVDAVCSIAKVFY